MSNYKWGDTWPDGTPIQPAAGMLVALDNGAWDVITAIYDEGEYPGDHRFIAIDTNDPAHGEYDGVYTPLAPAPTPGGLWDALGDLFGVDGNKIYFRMALETVDFAVEPHKMEPRPSLAWFLHHSFGDASDYPSHMRDMQKFGALLAYCAQEGWEADE